MQFLDLFPDFFDDRPAAARIEQWYFPHDPHFNAAGAAKVAQGFLARFRFAGHGKPIHDSTH